MAALPYLALPCLALPYLTLPYLTLPYLTLDSGVVNNTNMIEEDIMLDPSRTQEFSQFEADNGVTKRAAVTLNNRDYRWPNQILKYKIERSSGGTSVATIYNL